MPCILQGTSGFSHSWKKIVTDTDVTSGLPFDFRSYSVTQTTI